MRRLIFVLLILLVSTNCLAIQKNVNSQKWTIFAFDRTDNTAKTGNLSQITGSIWKDGVEDVIADTNPTELAHGYYEFDLDQAETNGNYLVMDAVSATGDIQVVGCPMAVWTTAPYFSALSIDASGRVDVAKWIGTAVTLSTGNKPDVNIDEISDDTTAPGNLELAYDGTGYAGGTIKQDVKIVSASQTALDAILKTTTFALAIADAIVDEDISKSEHNVTNSLAKKIRGIEHVTVLHEGQAQGAGGGNDTIELAETASAVNDWYKDDWVMLVEGTGENQMHHIESYVGNTRTATLGEDWAVNPDSSTDYVIIARSSVHTHRFEQDAKDEINAEVDSALSDYGANTTTPDASGTAAGLHSTTDGKVDANKTILDTLDGLVEDSAGDRFTEKALEQAPSGTGASAATIADAVWDEAKGDHTTEASFGGELGGLDPNITFILADTAAIEPIVTDLQGIDEIADAVWDEAMSGHTGEATFGGELQTLDPNVTLILADTAAYDTDAEYAEAIWGATVASYTDETDFGGELGGLDPNLALVLADTEAWDTANEARTLLTGGTTALSILTAANVEAEAYDAIELANLDHWMKVVTSNSATLPEVVDNTVLANILTKTDGDTSDYDFTEHSFEALRDRGDAAWTTGGGTGLTPLASGTAQGGSASTIQLADAETFANDELNGNVVIIHTGVGAGQSRLIDDYTGVGDTVDVTPNWTTNPDNTSQYEVWPASVNVEQIERTDATDAINAAADAAIVTYELDHLVYVADADDPADNSIVAKMFASDGDWSGASAAADSQEAIADAIVAFLSGSGVNLTAIEGHALAGTGTRIADGFEYWFNVATPGKTMNDAGIGGAVINAVYNIPSVIDIAGTATVRFSISIIDSVDDLPTTGEITPGTIKIETKRINGTAWTTVVDDDACSEAAGLIYYDEVLTTASGYREEDSLRITFKSQKITIGGNDFELTGTTGATFYSYIRKALPDVIYRPW